MKYNYFSKTIFGIFIASFTLAVVSFFITLINSDVKINLSNKGMIDFYNHYQASVVLLGVGITLLTLWATFERMNQTEKQLRFSNFHTHREEFIKTFSINPFIKEISSANECEPRILLNELYSFLFYKTYKDFVPNVNGNSYRMLEDFYSRIKKSELNKNTFQLKSLPSDRLHLIRYEIPPPLLKHIYRFSQYLQIKLLPPDDLSSYRAIEIEKERREILNSVEFLMIHDVFYTIKLIILLLGYDEIIKEPLHYLSENINEYRTELCLPFDLFTEL